MAQAKQIDRIDAADTLDELKRNQFLINAAMMILNTRIEEDDMEKVHYLLSLYQREMKEFMPRFEKIINV